MSQIAVILSTYKESPNYLVDCITSILKQTYEDFELIICTEPDEPNMDIIQSIASNDNRIKLLKNSSKLGISGSRNRGIYESSSKYIAIIDGDDYCDINRFERQLDFLGRHPNVSVVGSNMYIVDETSNIIGTRRYPEYYDDIRKKFLFTMAIANPTVMMRRKDIEEVGFFNNQFAKAEDFELWLRFLANSKIFYNMQECLVYYRVLPHHAEKRGRKHWKNNYRARAKYGKFIWSFSQRLLSLSLFFCISKLPDTVVNSVFDFSVISRVRNVQWKI